MNDVAEKLKAEANDFFKKQNYEAAIALYNKVSFDFFLHIHYTWKKGDRRCSRGTRSVLESQFGSFALGIAWSRSFWCGQRFVTF